MYSDFDLRRAVNELGLTRGPDVDLFPNVPPVEPSQHLRDWLTEFGNPALVAGSEFSRRETVLFPVLAEAKRNTPPPVNIAIDTVTYPIDRLPDILGILVRIASG